MRRSILVCFVLTTVCLSARLHGQEDVHVPEIDSSVDLPADMSDGMGVDDAEIEMLEADATLEDGETCCDCKKIQALNKKIAGAYKPLFYDNDFSYICDPCYCDWWPGDHLKRRCVGNHMVLDLGGQYRARYMDEHNIRTPGLGLTGNSD